MIFTRGHRPASRETEMSGFVLADFSPPALAQAVKTNLHNFFRYIARATPTESLGDPELTRWHTQVPFPWFNGVLASRPPTNGDEETVQTAIAWFKARAVTRFTWWLTPTLPRTGWEKLLRAQGFQSSDGPPGMAVELHALKEDGTRPGLHIAPVADEKTLQTWTRTFIFGYGLPPDWEKPLLKMMTGLGLDLPMRNYLGYLDGRPVATSNLFLSAGVAGVQFVATLPEARGQGLGGAMSLMPLLEARQIGYHIGVLQSSAMGFPVYRRLGFQQVCQVEHYYWAEASASEADGHRDH
ncbi:MAG: hypothetical protein QN141_00675 [Armatimonadota bacterium]|nr:hypothetical protein [Armatimonadota bacterium]MDR7450852.1 hypothetical protein [Armatimonadota bacterium]MDR7465773.1 hypothetical protein [Armatimonadota bacterium]MDR7493681.1 hypothetical protein [Armatimonadota bacterium]MDR7499070.1 hypothetical protein [Armatimonadota bacterium]